MWIPVVLLIFGVLLNVNGRKGWGWSMIALGVISGLIVAL